MNKIFPGKLGDVLSNKSFRDVFNNHCEIVQFVITLWEPKKCTGIFLDFYNFVMKEIQDPSKFAQHRDRCVAYVKNNNAKELPKYFASYLKEQNE